MSELIDNSSQRKEMLRHLLLRLHEGENPEVLRKRLTEVLSSIPYNEVVEVEQELIDSNALTEAEILDFCDLHTAVLDGSINMENVAEVPSGHPVDTFKQENRKVEEILAKVREWMTALPAVSDADIPAFLLVLKQMLNSLSDLEKHYKRKEYLLFPYLEKYEITGPPKVMWGKHDEIRDLLKAAHEATHASIERVEELKSIADLIITPLTDLIEGMIMKEEQILLPMCLDTLNEEEWFRIYQETSEFGYCLYDPQNEWTPSGVKVEKAEYVSADAVRLSSGAFHIEELEALFVHLPIDLTFVDKNDKVRFFSHSPKRIFERNRSIIGRDVRMCHPPGSVHIVEQIINDFKSGKENKASFWLSNFQGRFVTIDYTAVRSKEGEYLGVLEVTQDITALRQLEGDQRLLSYEKK